MNRDGEVSKGELLGRERSRNQEKYVCVVNQTPPWFLARLQVMTGAREASVPS